MGNSQSSHKISAQDRCALTSVHDARPILCAANASDRAILDMKNQRDKLHQYQKRITVITDREVAVAKACLAKGDKDRALLALRRKKFQESLLAKTDAQLATLEQLTANVEFSLVQKDVMFGLQQGTDVLKKINTEMGGVEKIEKLMEENEEAREYQRQIGEMLEGGLSRGDEEEVEDELDRLERDTLGVDSVSMPSEPDAVEPAELPNVPNKQPGFADELKDRARRKQMNRDRKIAEMFEPMAA